MAAGLKDEAAGVYYSLLHGPTDRAHQVGNSSLVSLLVPGLPSTDVGVFVYDGSNMT